MHLEEALGGIPFAEIERKDVREVRDVVAESAGPIQSNRVVALFNRVANWAVDEDRAKFNPAARLKKTGEERRRERILTNDELAQIWSVIDTPPQIDREVGGLTDIDLPAAIAVRRALKLLILTAQRRGEVIGMRKDEISLTEDDAWWTLPGERTKNGLPHRVPLTSMAVAVVREALADAGGSPFLFPSNRSDGPIRGDAVTKALQRICKRLKIEGVGPHDIRRTIGTTLRKLGVSVEDRSHLLNHISGAKSKVTSWNYDAGEHDVEKRSAIERWDWELRRVVGLAMPTVVQLRAG
jgi:integrase